jgi:hypothetical protein
MTGVKKLRSAGCICSWFRFLWLQQVPSCKSYNAYSHCSQKPFVEVVYTINTFLEAHDSGLLRLLYIVQVSPQEGHFKRFGWAFQYDGFYFRLSGI